MIYGVFENGTECVATDYYDPRNAIAEMNRLTIEADGAADYVVIPVCEWHNEEPAATCEECAATDQEDDDE